MGNPLWSKKALCYFGGAFILLLGGVIVVVAPYHATGYIALRGDVDAFTIWDEPGFHPQLEIGFNIQPRFADNAVDVDLTIHNNETLEETPVNITLTLDDQMFNVDPVTYERNVIVDIDPGNYTIQIDLIEGAADVELSLTQVSDSRTFIVIGGMMNIIGLIMGATGYCLGGTLIPSGEDAIVDYGVYEPRKDV
ncbi:MAG: hypothetical protein ACTSV2_11695 [Candidatus Thorarchaeota archaeon]